MVDTDPQMFCKRFQVYLSNLDYVRMSLWCNDSPQVVCNQTFWNAFDNQFHKKIVPNCQKVHLLPKFPVNHTCDSNTSHCNGPVFVCICYQDIADTLSTPYHWLALHIGGHGRVASYTCYMVRCPLTPCAILAGVKKPHLTTILDVRINLYSR